MRNKLKIIMVNNEINDNLRETIKFLKIYGIKHIKLRTIYR